MGNYNPDSPYVMGMQWPPLVVDPIVLDTGSEVGYTFRALQDHGLQGLEAARLMMTQPVPGLATRKELVCNVYAAAGIASTGPIRKLLMPCTTGAVQAGATAVGTAFESAAVESPADNMHVLLTGPSAACRFWFDSTSSRVRAALEWRRILDVSVLYVVSGPFDALPGAVTLGLERPSVNWVMDDNLTGPPAQGGSVRILRSRLGELNPWSYTASTPASSPYRLPWKLVAGAMPSGLAAFNNLANNTAGNINVRIGTTAAVPAGTLFQIHYVALEVTYCEENRWGAAGLDISAGPVKHVMANWTYDFQIYNAFSYGASIILNKGQEYAITVGQAYAGQQSVSSPVPITVDRLGSVVPFPEHRGVLLRKTLREGATPTVETVDALPSITMFTDPSLDASTLDVSSHSYLGQMVGSAYSRFGQGAQSQLLVDDTAGEYVWARFYARHLPGTDSELWLTQVDPADDFNELGPDAVITVEEFDVLPELVDGWREVTVRLSQPVVMTGAGGLTRWIFYANADDGAPWQILGADTNPTYESVLWSNTATYGGATAYAEVDAVTDLSADYTLMLAREMDLVAGFTVTPAVQPLQVVDEACGVPVESIPTGIRFHQMSWTAINSVVVAGWGYYEVQRQDDTMAGDEWEVIGKIGLPQVTAMDDYEARVGVQTRYRIRMVHRTGFEGPWSTVAAATIPAPGVTGARVDTGLLVFTSNHNPAGNLAYVSSFDRSGEEQFTFGEGDQTELQEMYGRDYRVAFRPTERAGVEFTRTLLVNGAGVPVETLDKGFSGLRDLAWDTVPYVCVRDELHNRWLSSLSVPSATVRRVPRKGHLELARVTVTEVTATPAPVDGGPAPCEGFTAPPKGYRLLGATAPAPVALMEAARPVAVSDDYEGRTVAAGGWGDAQVPALPWTGDGVLSDLFVAGGVGSMVWASPRNANPYFETDVASWTPTGGTFVRSTAQFHQGVASGLLTPSGVAAVVKVESEKLPIAPSQPWQASAWVRCPFARSVHLDIAFYDAGGVLLGTAVGSSVALVANTWTRLAISGASYAGVNVASAAMLVQMDTTPPAGHLLYIDEAAMQRTPATASATTGPALTDVDVQIRVKTDVLASGGALYAYALGRYVDANNHYRARLGFQPNGTLQVMAEKVVAGSSSTVGSSTTVTQDNGTNVPHLVGQWYWLRIECRGEMIRASAWRDGALDRPDRTSGVDTSLATGKTGVMKATGSGNTNIAARLDVGDFIVRTPVSDLDLRLEVRPVARQFTAYLTHYSEYTDTEDTFYGAGWDLRLGDDEAALEVFDFDVFYDSIFNVDDLVVTNQRKWVRATYDLDGGPAGLARAVFYNSDDGVSWTQVGMVEDTPEPPNLDSPGLLEVLVSPGVMVMRAELRLGINGTVIGSPDFESQPAGTKTFTDAQGNLWTVDGKGLCV